MEEKINHVFDEKIGNTVCQFDGKMWKLVGRTIPVRSISHVHYDKQLWTKVTALCCTLFCCALVGCLWIHRPEDFMAARHHNMLILLCVIEIILTLFLFVYNEHKLHVVTCSGKEVRIPSRDKEALKRLENALVESMRV